MSQSDQHRQLVISAALAIRRCHPTIQVTTDLLQAPGGCVPPIIGGYRPDVIAGGGSICSQVVIAEAKTDRDIDNHHTFRQINAFMNYLDALPRGTGIFILAVNGHAADVGRTVLRFTCRDRVTTHIHVKLFDGLDFWSLGPSGAPLWRLS